MENRKDWSVRILLFLPFFLSLVYLRKVPMIHFAHPRWVLVAICYAYIVPPVLDLIGGSNRANHHPGHKSWTTRAFEYIFLPRVLFAKILLLKFLMLTIVATGRFDIVDCLGIAFFTGQSISSYGIFVAHELLHRKSKLDKALAEIMMVTVMYPHFCIEHIYGHHRYAATARDPATSRLEETVYAFVPRSIFGGMFHAWRFEVAHLQRHGYHWFNFRNRMLRYAAEIVAMLAVVFYFFDMLGVLALFVQAVVAVVTLEVINYVQHYGLLRKEIAPGLHENTNVSHSWNSECWFSNSYWLNLGRHSDHHYAANRSFQMLRKFENEPELPAGFPAMFLLAFVPPLWFRVMNPRVEALKHGPSHQQMKVDVLERDQAAGGARGFQSWRSTVIDGSGLLLGTTIVMMFVADMSVGYPSGLVVVAGICLGVVTARYLLTHAPLSATNPGV
jgi:alkane 1-monooxygenase